VEEGEFEDACGARADDAGERIFLADGFGAAGGRLDHGHGARGGKLCAGTRHSKIRISIFFFLRR
jgi:hypothetical protein